MKNNGYGPSIKDIGKKREDGSKHFQTCQQIQIIFTLGCKMFAQSKKQLETRVIIETLTCLHESEAKKNKNG